MLFAFCVFMLGQATCLSRCGGGGAPFYGRGKYDCRFGSRTFPAGVWRPLSYYLLLAISFKICYSPPKALLRFSVGKDLAVRSILLTSIKDKKCGYANDTSIACVQHTHTDTMPPKQKTRESHPIPYRNKWSSKDVLRPSAVDCMGTRNFRISPVWRRLIKCARGEKHENSSLGPP